MLWFKLHRRRQGPKARFGCNSELEYSHRSACAAEHGQRRDGYRRGDLDPSPVVRFSPAQLFGKPDVVRMERVSGDGGPTDPDACPGATTRAIFAWAVIPARLKPDGSRITWLYCY